MEVVKHLAAVALLVAGITLPLCGQRGESHGGFSGARSGFSGHSAPAFRGFASPAPTRSAGFSRPMAPMGSGYPSASLGRGGPTPYHYGSRPGYPGGGNRPGRNYYYRSHNRGGFSYGLPLWPGWIDPGLQGYSDGFGDDDSAPSQDSSGYDVQQQPVEQEDQSGPPPQQGYQPDQPNQSTGETAPAVAAAPPASESTITLIFKDGRPQEHIHNYVLTRSTLYIRDGHPIAIPLNQIDLVATAKANQGSDADFHLPKAPR